MLFLAMLLLGAVIGFVGAGGAGVTIAMLVVGFHVPMCQRRSPGRCCGRGW